MRESQVQASAQPAHAGVPSFAFKHGVPLDADYVSDVRMLPNRTTSASCR